MFNVLLDTNVLLDFLSADRPSHGATRAALKACLEHDDVRVMVPACLLKDVYFVYERHYGSEADARRKILLVRQIFEVVDLTIAIVDDALVSDEPDFEDAIVRATAEAVGASVIFSRDERACLNSPVPRMSADEILKSLEEPVL